MRTIALSLSILISIAAWAQAAIPRVALVLDRGGKDDKSFNAAAYLGGITAKQKLGIFLKEIEAGDDSLYEPAMKSFAEKKFDLIIGIGVAQSEVVRKLAKEIPTQKFAIVDAKIEGPNVVSLLFEEQEGSYLMGYIAGMKTKTGTVGFIGGVNIPLIHRFETAYLQGARAARPNIKTLVNYIGVTGEAWNNPTKAQELAQNQYRQGVDIIFTAAGSSNNGVFDAAEATNHFAIGVDSNQNWIKPGHILTSMLKRVDTAVYEVISDLKAGHLVGGVRRYGLKNQGVDWALDSYNQKLFTQAEINKVYQIKNDIIKGTIQVEDYYTQKR